MWQLLEGQTYAYQIFGGNKLGNHLCFTFKIFSEANCVNFEELTELPLFYPSNSLSRMYFRKEYPTPNSATEHTIE